MPVVLQAAPFAQHVGLIYSQVVAALAQDAAVVPEAAVNLQLVLSGVQAVLSALSAQLMTEQVDPTLHWSYLLQSVAEYSEHFLSPQPVNSKAPKQQAAVNNLIENMFFISFLKKPKNGPVNRI